MVKNYNIPEEVKAVVNERMKEAHLKMFYKEKIIDEIDLIDDLDELEVIYTFVTGEEE